MELFEFVGSKIREHRLRFGGKGISQEVLAEKLDVTANTVSRWETATYNPSLKDLESLARFFSVSILEFLPDKTESEEPHVSALLRTARQLEPSDLKELQKYAEFRYARHIVGESKKKKLPK